jgi:GDP-D-mannose dehydratase
MSKQKHPFIEKYPLKSQCKYLVLGTFPPAQKLENKEDRKFNVDYFYGNVASFWKIVQEIYPPYYRPIDIQLQIGDAKELIELTGWEPKIPIEQTMQDLLTYWINKLKK